MQTSNVYYAIWDIYQADGEPDQALERVAAKMVDRKCDIIQNADASVKGPYLHRYKCHRGPFFGVPFIENVLFCDARQFPETPDQMSYSIQVSCHDVQPTAQKSYFRTTHIGGLNSEHAQNVQRNVSTVNSTTLLSLPAIANPP